MDQPRNVIVKDIEIMYARLSRAVENPFSKKQQWEMLMVVPEARKAELEALHLTVKPVKDKAGFVGASVRRNVQKSDGSDNGPVRVVDEAKNPFTDVAAIGNGTIANVILFQYPWENMGRKGISSSLTAVQITKFERYEATDSVDFDVVGSAPAGENADLF